MKQLIILATLAMAACGGSVTPFDMKAADYICAERGGVRSVYPRAFGEWSGDGKTVDVTCNNGVVYRVEVKYEDMYRQGNKPGAIPQSLRRPAPEV